MKKLLLILFLYLLVEGDNVIGDGLYVYHRGKHAVDELKTKVDEYYPKIEAVDSTLIKALSDEKMPKPVDGCSTDSAMTEEREVIRRHRRVIHR